MGPFNNNWEYPPLAYLVGALAMFVGGVNVSTPIIAENIVFARESISNSLRGPSSDASPREPFGGWAFPHRYLVRTRNYGV